MKTYKWTTAKGAKVELKISQQHTEIAYCDGDNVEITKNEMQIESFTVNGVKHNSCRLITYKGTRCIQFSIKGQNALTPVADSIYTEIMAPTKERLSAEMQAEETYQKHYNAVKKAMSY